MIKGILLILGAEFLFTLGSAFAKEVTLISNIGGAEITLFRFVVGLICMTVFVYNKKLSLSAQKPFFVVLRGIFNTIAVMLLFAALSYTTVSNANMLNMTYPVFVFLLSPLINKESSRKIYYIFLFLAMAGIYLVAFPDLSSINIGDILALGSAIAAGFGITTLRQAGKYDSPYVILFYLMVIGTIINGMYCIPNFIVPFSAIIWVYIIISACTGFAGQILLTVGYRHIDARSGALVSSSRTIFAIAIGAFIFGDEIGLRISAGCILILIALAALSGFFEKFIKKGKSHESA